jgi:long-chain fatty acid transport protein
MQLGRGMARIIGGVSYGEVDALLSRQTFLAFGNPGIGTFTLSDEAWSWRLGAAYEIPEIAFRASIVYSAAYEYDNLTGTVDTTGFGPTLIPGLPPSMLNPPLITGIRPVSASSEIPQALDIKVQSGIAPGWLAFASVRWQDWSKLQSIPISGVISPIFGTPSPVSFDPFYRDGWTVSGGIGHAFTEHFSGAASVTWDRGTSTISGTQSDTWTFGAGGSWTPNENVELRFGGSIGVLTAGSSTFGGGDPANAITYTYEDDLLYALSGSFKVKWGPTPAPPPPTK